MSKDHALYIVIGTVAIVVLGLWFALDLSGDRAAKQHEEMMAKSAAQTEFNMTKSVCEDVAIAMEPKLKEGGFIYYVKGRLPVPTIAEIEIGVNSNWQKLSPMQKKDILALINQNFYTRIKKERPQTKVVGTHIRVLSPAGVELAEGNGNDINLK